MSVITKKWLRIAAVYLLLVTLAGCVEPSPGLENEKIELEEPESEEIEVYSLPVSEIEQIILYPVTVWDEEQPLKDEDCAELIEMLSLVEYSGPELSYDDYDGITDKMFRLELNREPVVFSACAPFYIIDFRGYKAKYLVCNSISNKYYQLVEEYFPKEMKPAN